MWFYMKYIVKIEGDEYFLHYSVVPAPLVTSTYVNDVSTNDKAKSNHDN